MEIEPTTDTLERRLVNSSIDYSKEGLVAVSTQLFLFHDTNSLAQQFIY